MSDLVGNPKDAFSHDAAHDDSYSSFQEAYFQLVVGSETADSIVSDLIAVVRISFYYAPNF